MNAPAAQGKAANTMGPMGTDRDLTTMTPVEIDTNLADLHTKLERLIRYSNYLRRATKLRPAQVDELADYDTKIAELRAQADTLELEHRRRGWNRYFLVTNTGGHVHRSTNCTTCYPTTRYAWIVDLADCDEAEMIVEFGEKACTVCFPDAPTHRAFAGPGRRDAEAVARRAIEKAERDAIKAAKNLTVDEMFVGLGRDRVRTVAAAKTQLREAAEAAHVASIQPDNVWWSERAAAGVEITRMAREVLTGRGLSDDALDTIIARATTKARKEWPAG